MSAAALVRLGATGPALRFLDWVLGILDEMEPPALLRPVYTVTGGNLGPEGEIAELPGYLGSRPVRSVTPRHNSFSGRLRPVADRVALLARGRHCHPSTGRRCRRWSPVGQAGVRRTTASGNTQCQHHVHLR